MTNTHQQRRFGGKGEDGEGQELSLDTTMLASHEEFNSLESLTEVKIIKLFMFQETHRDVSQTYLFTLPSYFVLLVSF